MAKIGIVVKADRPDSDFKHRIVSGYQGRRLTWHSMDCATGKNAKYPRRTVYTPESRRETHKAQFEEKYGTEQTWRWGLEYPNDYMAKCCLGKAETDKSPSFTTGQAKSIFAEALAAGLAAGDAAKPRAMVVGTPSTFLGDDIDYNKRTYYVSEGVCGFAWVVIRPGNSSLARQSVKLGIGSKAYGGGVSIWVGDHGQSLERKEQHARAYADVLRSYGVNAYLESRMD